MIVVAPIRRRRAGFTLMEMVVALSIMSILMLAMGSVVFLASRALPAAGSTMIQATRASEVADRIASELSTADYIVERSPTAITFTVPDRNGDGKDERIGYWWSGKPGAALMRSYDGHTAVPVLKSVGSFQLVYNRKSVTETYPGIGVEDATERLLLDSTNTTARKTYNIDANHWIGQYVLPRIPADAIGWRPTRVKILIAPSGSRAWGTVKLTSADANLKPGGTTLSSQSFSSFGSMRVWDTFNFFNLGRLGPDQGLCLTVSTTGTSGTTAVLSFDDRNGSGRLTTDHAGADWLYDNNKSLICQVYGKLTMPGPGQHLIRQYLVGVQIRLQRQGQNQLAVVSSAGLLNSPELDAGLWQLDFIGDPTATDVNGDGQADWKTTDGSTFATSTLAGGIWRAGDSPALLETQPANAFTGPTTVSARLQDTTASGAGAIVTMDVDVGGGRSAVLVAVLQKQADNTQSLLVYNVTGTWSLRMLLFRTGLPSGFINLRLLVDPGYQSVNIRAAGKYLGTFGYVRYSNSYGGFVTAGSRNGDTGVEFDSLSVREVAP